MQGTLGLRCALAPAAVQSVQGSSKQVAKICEIGPIYWQQVKDNVNAEQLSGRRTRAESRRTNL